jgi:hypothetical protein
MWILLCATVVFAAAWIVGALKDIRASQDQYFARVEEVAHTQMEAVKAIAEDMKTATGYLRYLRARAWQDDPTFIEDINEGSSAFAPSWHSLKREYGLWVREDDKHEGAMRIMRGETTKTEAHLRELLGDTEYQRISKLRRESEPDQTPT